MKKEIHPGTPVGRLPDEAVDRHPDQLTNQSVRMAVSEVPAGSDSGIAQQSPTQNISVLPVDVLPPRLQEIINEANICLGFPKDYLAGAMLTAMAAVIGNTHTAEIMPGWKEYAILSQPLSEVAAPTRATR